MRQQDRLELIGKDFDRPDIDHCFRSASHPVVTVDVSSSDVFGAKSAVVEDCVTRGPGDVIAVEQPAAANLDLAEFYRTIGSIVQANLAAGRGQTQGAPLGRIFIGIDQY